MRGHRAPVSDRVPRHTLFRHPYPVLSCRISSIFIWLFGLSERKGRGGGLQHVTFYFLSKANVPDNIRKVASYADAPSSGPLQNVVAFDYEPERLIEPCQDSILSRYLNAPEGWQIVKISQLGEIVSYHMDKPAVRVKGMKTFPAPIPSG